MIIVGEEGNVVCVVCDCELEIVVKKEKKVDDNDNDDDVDNDDDNDDNDDDVVDGIIVVCDVSITVDDINDDWIEFVVVVDNGLHFVWWSQLHGIVQLEKQLYSGDAPYNRLKLMKKLFKFNTFF